ncbi:hypothetical protein [Dactylosporangium darangshiense]|uniref:Uncharacterized protein n=1 Tax=Dactylosporangium darangshiense TaxID=579108 RepID=A0ABP8DPX5_9ACTN
MSIYDAQLRVRALVTVVPTVSPADMVYAVVEPRHPQHRDPYVVTRLLFNTCCSGLANA